MIGYENTLGTVEISQEYFANLIGMAASECYGVAGMINSTYQGLRYAITKSDVPDKGVRVKTTDGKLIVDIHIAVTYGINISAIAPATLIPDDRPRHNPSSSSNWRTTARPSASEMRNCVSIGAPSRLAVMRF